MAEVLILNGSHFCDLHREHRNDECYDHNCVCPLCFSFWHWNIWQWEQALTKAED